MKRNESLQALCRDYLGRLRYLAKKRGLGVWLSDIINANRRGECSATKKEVEMLSRLCNDERVTRTDVPKMLGKSYRQCVGDNDFDKVLKLERNGIYSKVSALILKDKTRK